MKTYKDLREIDVSAYIEKKGKLSYLSWAWAVDQLMLLDPEATWEYGEIATHGNDTKMVFCTVHAFNKSRTAQLPVMNFKNEPIKSPDAFAVNTAMQRALAKAIALHGIGLYIYAGEDVPDSEPVDEKSFRENKIKQRDFLYGLGLCQKPEEIEQYMSAWADDLSSMPTMFTDAMNDAAGSRLEGLKKGTEFKPHGFSFVDVSEATAFAKEASQKINNASDLGDISAWVSDNDHMLKALDTALTAAKYQTEDGSPYQRIVKLYNNKVTDLKGRAT